MKQETWLAVGYYYGTPNRLHVRGSFVSKRQAEEYCSVLEKLLPCQHVGFKAVSYKEAMSEGMETTV